jgi:hypothetical protein
LICGAGLIRYGPSVTAIFRQAGFTRPAGALAVWLTACVIGSWIAGILVRILYRTSPVKVGLGGRWCTVVL